MKLLATVCMVVSLAPLLAAQRVTPVYLASKSGWLPYDFMNWRGQTARYQQIVGDLGAPLVATQIAFRGASHDSVAIARTIDLELKVGLSSFAARTVTFAGNLQAPVQAIARKNVNWPSHTTPPSGGYPAPFDCVLAFDSPWVFPGNQDVAFEIVVYANTGYLKLYALDGTDEDMPYFAPYTKHGAGCVASSRAKELTLYPSIGVRYGRLQHTFSWHGNEAPPQSPGVLCLGLAQLTLTLPELCAPLQLYPIVATLGVATSVYDTWSLVPSIDVPFDPSAVGLRVYAQAAFADAGQPSLAKAALTAGASASIPPLPTPPPVPIAFVYNDQLASNAGSLETYKGLVVQWQ